MKRKLPVLLIVYLCTLIPLHAQQFIPLVENIPSSFRGMDTHAKNVVWVSGSKGTVGKSLDQGKTWSWVNPKGYENLDFRDIEVFSRDEAIIMSAGTPAVILRTTDGGISWTKAYEDNRPEIFLDAIAFEGKLGYAIGDPIDNSFQLLETTDKGKTWRDVSKNILLFADNGEVAFAASGSSIQIHKKSIYIGTGGSYSSLFCYNPTKLRNDKYDVPIWSGESSTGIFAIDFWNQNIGIAVGGNYLNDLDNHNNILLTYDGGNSWHKPESPVLGFRSDVLYITKNIVLATGTSGTDISYDNGKNWKNISTLSFNTIAKNKTGSIIYLTGSEGNVYKLIL